MTKMRGCCEFDLLWERRTTIEDADGFTYELLGIADLVKAKKTQRDKDWPIIRRLLDAHYDQYQDEPTDDRVRFWLRESRTPEVLIRVAAEYPKLLKELIKDRPLLEEAMGASRSALQNELVKEQDAEREADRHYWRPLVNELEAMQLIRRNANAN